MFRQMFSPETTFIVLKKQKNIVLKRQKKKLSLTNSEIGLEAVYF